MRYLRKGKTVFRCGLLFAWACDLSSFKKRACQADLVSVTREVANAVIFLIEVGEKLFSQCY